ncbi:DUF3549 family protein [Shewanella intestini]|uniref:DUF3549 family protein n=1 Tax=Shewanella intestini TaxID=2017544 RepID=A0ABS5HZD1_9GAMM|nr:MULTISPECIES: DUF3549 family protein [Shewanella]MBR9726779.1 DUF3549 family protein [Shewanella intestini]MRG34655.1 DUF3549 family protein [Shewanella sp. XMDDZSB0408]
MTDINTLSQFLTTANTQFQVYDLGRRVQSIDMMAFHQIEELAAPYPYPTQGHAHFAIVFWQQAETPYIWFLKLPLDERGLLSPAQRSHFLKMVLEALGRDPTQPISDEQQETLSNHPFTFKPSQEKLAVFNALVRQQLGQQASSQYEFAVEYLSGQIHPDNWQQIGLQGIADVCIRAEKNGHTQDLINSFDFAPTEVQAAICQCLEHVYIAPELAQRIARSLNLVPSSHKTTYIRALASQPKLVQSVIKQLDEQNKLNDEMLITIAARNWHVLSDDAVRKIYLEALAKQPQHFFNQVFADIVAIPSLRHALLTELRNPERSPQLSTAIGGLFKALSQ